MASPLTGATIDHINNILKVDYQPRIRSQINRSTILSKMLRKTPTGTGGANWDGRCHIGRSPGTQAARENSSLPEAGYQRYAKYTGQVRYIYATLQLSGPVLAASRSSAFAFASAMASEMTNLVTDAKIEKNRQYWGDGSGRLGVLRAPHSSATMSVQHPQDIGNQGTVLQNIIPGDRLALEDISGTTIVPLSGTSFAEVASVDLDAKTVTMSAAITAPGGTAAGDGLVKGPNTTEAVATNISNFRGQSGGAALDPVEIDGLVALINGPGGWTANAALTYAAIYNVAAGGEVYAGSNSGSVVRGTVHNLFATYWRSAVLGNSGVLRPLNKDLFQKGLDTVEVLGQARPDMFLMSYALRRQAVNMLYPNVRYVEAATKRLDGGFESIDFNGIPMYVDKDAIPGVILGLNLSQLEEMQMADWTWADDDGSILQRTSVDGYEARLYNYCNLRCNRRNSQLLITDLLEN
jgi:hypothetical protein